ncbi:MAG: TlyA family RNA methyltransferase [Hyphomicrobiaceae bacterium]
MSDQIEGGTRLDRALAARGLVSTRSRGRDLILRGFVLVDGVVVVKPSQSVARGSDIALLANAPEYVSRAGEKLATALDHFAFKVDGCVALDVGASTGGFSDVLLRHGARRVFAVDVGRDQLDAGLRRDARLTSLEATDARDLSPAMFDAAINAIVVDVSFISLRQVLPNVLQIAATPCWLVALVKPQFEVGPDFVGKDGVVRDEAALAAAVDRNRDWLDGLDNWFVGGVIASPLRGGAGNREFLIGAQCND